MDPGQYIFSQRKKHKWNMDSKELCCMRNDLKNKGTKNTLRGHIHQYLGEGQGIQKQNSTDPPT